MTKKKADSVTYICFVRDHSGSMYSKVNQARDNFNEQLAKLLKEDDETMDNIVTIIEFDDQIHCNIEGRPITEVKKLTDWWTGGMTALFDAIGYGINKVKKQYDADDREDKAVLVVVQTDGGENQSSDFEGEEGRLKIKKMIDELEATGNWTFTFLGENLDTSYAQDLGFKRGNIMAQAVKKGNEARFYAFNTNGLGDYLKSRKRGMTQTYQFYSGNDTGNMESENINITNNNKLDN